VEAKLSVALLTVNLRAKTAAFIAGMTKASVATGNLTRSVNTAKSSMMGFVAAATLGIPLVTKALFDFIKTASHAEEITNKFNVVMGDFAVSTEKWAVRLGDATGRATQDVKKWLATLQDTFVPMGFSRDLALDLSKSLVQLGIDLGSFNDRADPEVISLLTSAIAGNHRAVRSMGIVLSEVGILQEAWNAGIQKSFRELTNQEKAMLRFRIILRSSLDAQGDAIRTQETFANQSKRLNANITELKETIGKTLLLPVSEWLRNLNLALQGATENATEFGESVKSVAKVLVLWKALAEFVFKVTATSLSVLVTGVTGLLGGLFKLIPFYDKWGDALLDISKKANKFGSDQIQSFKEIKKSVQEMFDLLDSPPKGLDVTSPTQPPGLADPSKLKAAAEAQAKLIQDAGSLFDRTRTATEKYAIEIGKLDNLLEKGIINWDLYARGVREAREELENAAKAQAKQLIADPLSPASAREIRSGFVSVSGLATGPDPVVNELKLQTDILREMNRSIGILSIEEALAL
jgi:hypothetical protein